MTAPQLDLFAARLKRDKAIKRVVDRQEDPWKALYRHHAEQFLTHRICCDGEEGFIGEDLRVFLEPIIGAPKHHNAWGGMAAGVLRKWMKEKKIAEQGMGQMRGAKSHARRTPQYVVVLSWPTDPA